MTERRCFIVLAACVVVYAFATSWSVHSQRMAWQPIIDEMIAECRAGSRANYCKPPLTEEERHFGCRFAEADKHGGECP